jgi:hypothetical protein
MVGLDDYNILQHLTSVVFVPFLCKQYFYLSCERLHMAGLDDYNILQPGHLVGSRLGGTHDSINV